MLERLKITANPRLIRARTLASPFASHRPPTRTRRAFSLVEVIAAIVLLAMLLSLSVKGLSALSASQRRIEQRGWAVQTAASVLEQATGRDPAEIDSAFVQQMSASTQVQQTLSGGQLTIDVGEATALGETPVARRVTVVVGWNDRAGMPVAPVRLSAWVHPLAQIADTPTEKQPAETDP